MRHWRIQYGSRQVYLWHQHSAAGTGAVWDDADRRLTLAEAEDMAATPGPHQSLPWAEILAAWTPTRPRVADRTEEAIYGRRLKPGDWCRD